MANEITEVASKASKVDEKLRALKADGYNQIKGLSEGEIKNVILEIIKGSNISENQLKLLGLAISVEDGSSALQSGANAYASALANKFYRNKENLLEQNKETPKSTFHIIADKEHLKKLDDKEMKKYAYECLSQADMPEELMNKPVSNFENLNMEYRTNLGSEGTILEATTALFIKVKQFLLSQEKQNAGKSTGSHGVIPAHQRDLLGDIHHEFSHAEQKDLGGNENNEPPPSNRNSEESEELYKRAENVGEGTGNINFFVGYNKKEVAKLFSTRPHLLEVFEEFVEKYNFIMNLYTMGDLDEEQSKDFLNDILPYFYSMANACSAHGGEGSQIKNLCDGMMSILKDACTAEINGKELDPQKTKLTVEKMGLSYKDDDGKQNDAITLSDKSPEEQTFDGTFEDIQNIVGYGITRPSSRTHDGVYEVMKELESLGIVKTNSLKPTTT